MGKQAVMVSANRGSMHNPLTPKKTTHEVPPRPLPIFLHSYRRVTHPALRGVLPCIEPTVRTVGVTTPAYSPRNAAEWRCGFGGGLHTHHPLPTLNHKIWRSAEKVRAAYSPTEKTSRFSIFFQYTEKTFSKGGVVHCIINAGGDAVTFPLAPGRMKLVIHPRRKARELPK